MDKMYLNSEENKEELCNMTKIYWLFIVGCERA